MEDNQDHALLVRIAVRRTFPGLDVRVAGDGKEGVAYLAGKPPFAYRHSHPFPNLILLDLIMPVVGGFRVLEWMAEADLIDKVPAIVLTSSVNPGDEEKALALGARAFHSKPADLDELGRIVHRLATEWIL
ncbi:MAG: response regulator [Gemmatimonadetes bacterium]|nr:response regulator [Gemmatimonadota bacterium]